MSSYIDQWKNELHNGLIANTGKPAPVASGMITKSLAHEQVQDMKHDRFEVISDTTRQSKLRFNNKYRYGNHRSISFLPQE